MWNKILRLFKNKVYRNGMYIGISQEFRDLYLQAEQLILDEQPKEALKLTKHMLLYLKTQGDADSIKRIMAAL